MKQVYMINLLEELPSCWELFREELSDVIEGNDTAIRWYLEEDEGTSDFTKTLNEKIFGLGVPKDTEFVMLWISW